MPIVSITQKTLSVKKHAQNATMLLDMAIMFALTIILTIVLVAATYRLTGGDLSAVAPTGPESGPYLTASP